MIRQLLRTTAVLIAVAAMFDPVFSGFEAEPRPVVVVNMTSAPVEDAIRTLGNRVAGRQVLPRDITAGRLPCSFDEECLVIADGTVDATWDARLRPVSIIKLPRPGGINVRVTSVGVTAGHRAAAGVVRVSLEGTGVDGKRSEVRVLDGDAVVGTATQNWSTSNTATLDVPWWPLDASTRALRVEALPVAGEIVVTDNRVDVGARVSNQRAPVLVFDARPSWHSTFIRRALEQDARFTVAHRARVAPALTAGTSNGRLDAGTLDRVSLVIIGAPDGLTPEDVDLLERYVRHRGGSLILLPEQRPAGADARLFDGRWTEHLSATAEAIGQLRASEVLRAASLSPAASVIATSAGSASIVSNPHGAGRIVISGAMDAWRYRGALALSEVEGFDQFWRSMAAEAAAAGEPLTLRFDDPLIERSGRLRFTLRDRRIAPLAAIEASAVQRCGEGAASTIRLWPVGAIGEFAGEASAEANGSCVVEASVGDRQVSASFDVIDRPARGIDRTLAKLERLALASGGVVATSDDLTAISGVLGANASSTMSRVVSVYPMRSTWWMLPFVACLSIEWWLRRRTGLR